jgi:tetratricopeptide (TPR) repeat protein
VRARCLVNANYAAAESGDLEGAVVFAERAVAEAELDVGPGLDRMAGPVAVLASAYTAAGRYGAARREHERGLALLRDSGLGESVRAATSLNNAALNLLVAGAPREALPLFEQTMALDRNAGTAGFSSMTAASYALALWQVGRNGEALEWATKAIDEARRQNDQRSLGRALLTAARVRRQAGELQQAEALLQQAATTLASAPPRHPAHAALKVVQGMVATDKGELQRAHDLLAEASATYGVNAPRSGDRALALAALADVHVRRGEAAAALDRAQAALDLARTGSADLPHSYRVAVAALSLCNARRAAVTGDAAQACDLAITHAAGAAGEDSPITRQARALRAELSTSPQDGR